MKETKCKLLGEKKVDGNIILVWLSPSGVIYESVFSPDLKAINITGYMKGN